MRKTFVLFSLLATLSALGDPGHSANGEAFNEGPRQAAVLIPGCGDVKFPISSKKPDVQPFFTQGVGQLHGFWYYEAERSFRQVAAIDPDCAMAYWGMSMANVNNEKRAKAFIKEATKRKDKASPREKQWISVLENLYREDKRDKKQRSLDCIKDFEALVQDDPKDIEAKAFLVWRIWFSRTEAPISSNQAVDALLDQIFAANPNHPAHHYRIHLWDQSKPILALKSGAQCGQAAPGIAHMWHMPGHTFSKLKRHDDAAWQQEASTRVDHAYMIRQFVLPDQIHNYAHNEEWLVRTYNDLGRAHDAIGLARSLIAIPRHPSYNTLDKQNTSASYGRTRLIDTLIKWEMWNDLKTFTATPVGHPAHDITRLRASGVAAYHQNDTKGLAAALKDLEAVKTETKPVSIDTSKVSSKPGKEPTSPAPDATKDLESADPVKTPDKPKEPESAKKSSKTGEKPKPEKPEVKAKNNASAELKALMALLDAKKPKADRIKLLDALKDTDVPKERLARYWLKLDDKTKAIELTKNFAQDLSGFAAKAEVLHICDKADDAKKALAEVRKLAFAIDKDLPVAQRMEKLAAHYSSPSILFDNPAPKRTDSGTRPSIESLGPVHWHPPAAPTFEALTLDNKIVKSTDFTAKKPTLFIFYLGYECGHCVEQIQAFAKATADFEKAGIQLVAVTLEPTQIAGNIRTKLNLGKDQPLPFPILSDSSQNAFKAVRAHDDFEKDLLHATLLVDPANKLRWLDISWEPFKNAKFALEESKRLLQLPAESTHASE
jgi:peroxiredoxin